jgi:hypothetical protein
MADNIDITTYKRVSRTGTELSSDEPSPVIEYFPQISQPDIDNEYITRYFCRQANHKASEEILEISQETYNRVKLNTLYNTVQLKWRVAGKLDDGYVLYVGQTRQLTPNIRLKDTDTYRWVSTDPEILSVTETGLVGALAPGDASINIVKNNKDVYTSANFIINQLATVDDLKTSLRTFTGVVTANKLALQQADKQLPGMINKILNPAQFYRGRG